MKMIKHIKKIPSFRLLQQHVSLFLTIIQLSIIIFVFIPPINAQTKLIRIFEPNDWTKLIDSLSKAKMAGINIYVSLLPPSKTPPICPTCNYSEPYRLDFIHWAKEIANLSLRYSNLTGYAIEDFQENLNLGYIRQTYIDSMITAGKSINPRLQFITLHNIYYVDRDASGNGSGSSWANASKTVSGLPWSSINGGDTVYVSGGSDSTAYYQYDAGAGKNYFSKTTTGNPIVITKGWESGHNGDVYFAQAGSPAKGYSFDVGASHNIKLTNLKFNVELAGTDGGAALLLYNCSNIIVDNCQITSDGSGFGIYFATCDSITINNCTITVPPNNSTTESDNIHAGNGNGGHIITNNKFYNYSYNATPHTDLIQIGLSGSASNLQTVIANNFFYYDPPLSTAVGNGVNVSGSYGDRYLIYNNVFVMHTALSACAITMYRYDGSKHLSARIYNNTIVTNMTPAGAITFISALDTVIIKNNIVVHDSGAREYLGFSGASINSTTYKDIDYNHYWSHNPSGGDPYIKDSTNHSVSWNTWKGWGYDAHSDTGVVSFANLLGTNVTDYEPTAGSNCIDTGTPISIFDTDIEGTLRPQRSAWDKGAFER